jgi:uncharacterized DUF497 family protein
VAYEWDEAKRKANLRKHGFDFVDAPSVFDGLTVTVLDERQDYGEDRFITLGLLKNVVVVVIHTERRGVIRIISLRKAARYEEDYYYAEIGDELGSNQGNGG